MRVEATFADLTAGNHGRAHSRDQRPRDANTADTLGPVATTTPTFTGFPTGATVGSFDHTFDMTLASSYRAGWITDSGGHHGSRRGRALPGDRGGPGVPATSIRPRSPAVRSAIFLAVVPEPGPGTLTRGRAGGSGLRAPKRSRARASRPRIAEARRTGPASGGRGRPGTRGPRPTCSRRTSGTAGRAADARAGRARRGP